MNRAVLHSHARVLTRAVHTSTVDGALVARKVVQAPRSPEHPVELQLRSLGSGLGAPVQVDLPASTPFYTRRNALSGVLGSVASSVIARSIIFGQPLTRLLARQPLTGQRILSTEPSTLLVGSRKPATLTPLKLDGTVDWVVSAPASVDAFAGPLVRAHTSWAIGASAPFAHLLVRGRGAAVVSTPSTLVTLEVEAGDSVLVHRKFLAAFSVDPLRRIHPKNVDIAYSFRPAATSALTPPELPAEEVRLATDSAAQRAWQTTKRALRVSWRAVHSLYTVVSTRLKRGNSQFVRISGPSTVLVSSSSVYARGEPTVKESTK